MYIYFDTNGTIKEIVNDKSIRQGSTEANKIYCYIEGNPTIDDIWYMQKLPSGETSNEVSFKNSTVTKAIPYDAKRDMRYFKDFEQYTFYVFTLNAFLVSQKGLNLATIRIVVDNEIFALGELTFNVQENVINVDNGITISQYDYLLLAYASRTLNEVTANDLDALLDDKINAKIGDLANGSPKVFDTEANIEAMHDDEGIAVATDTGYIYVWNDTQEQYISTGLLYVGDISLYYTKTESDNRYAQLGADNIFTGDNDFRGESLFSDDINQASGDFSSQGNVEAHSFTKQGTNLDDIYASKSNTYTKDETDTLLNAKADKTNTYTKSEVNTALNLKADKSTTYTKTETDNLLSAKADKTTVNGIDNRVGALENEITDLQSVQNVVDVVATKSALNSYDTSKLEENDKIQVIADETHGGASTVYNWNGSAWEYVGAYGGNSYTKTQTDALLDLKADKSDTYTKTQVDNKLDLKADKTDTYTKTEIDTILNTVLIEKSFESLAVDQLTITGYVTQEILNSIGARTQVKLRIYDSSNDLTFILAPNMTPENNFYNYKCTFNSPIDADGMIEIQGCISSDREYSFVLKNIKVYTEAEVNTALNGKMNKANPTGTGSISMNSGTASGTNSYANGSGATASGNFSTAKGYGATASGSYSTAVGSGATASGTDSVAYGNGNNVSGDFSFALGTQLKAKCDYQMVFGKFNISDNDSLEIVGNGQYMNPNNARLLDSNGNEYLAGDLYINTTFTKDANGDLDTKSGTKLVAVSANPTLQGGEADLTSITIDNTNYAIPSGSGGGSKSYLHKISITFNLVAYGNSGDISLLITNSNNTPIGKDFFRNTLGYNGSNNLCYIQGFIDNTSSSSSYKDKYIVIGFYITSSWQLGLRLLTLSDLSIINVNSYYSGITDTVTEV